MAEKNTRWENDKEWAGWTLRDEIYAFIRSHLGPIVSGMVGGAVSAIIAGIKSYPTVAASIGTAVLTLASVTVLAIRDGRERRQQNAQRERERLGSYRSEVEAHEEAPFRQEGLKEPVGQEPKPVVAQSQKQAVPDEERAAKYFDTFAPQPARRSTDYDVSYWIKLGTLYGVQNGILTLRFPPDTGNRDEDALLLLLYGYRQIYARQEVEARKLEQGLYWSHCRKKLPPQTASGTMFEMNTGQTRDDRIDVDDLAKSWILEGKISEKFGLSRGGFYAITDKGLAEIEKIFDDLVRRA